MTIPRILTLASAIVTLFTSQASAFESHMKLRLHKDMVQNLFSKNFDLILKNVEKGQEKDVQLDDIGTVMTDVVIGIRPVKGQQWADLSPFETFFDDG